MEKIKEKLVMARIKANYHTLTIKKSELAEKLKVSVKTISRDEKIALECVPDYVESRTINNKLKLKTPLTDYQQYCLVSIRQLMEVYQDREVVINFIEENPNLLSIDNFMSKELKQRL